MSNQPNVKGPNAPENQPPDLQHQGITERGAVQTKDHGTGSTVRPGTQEDKPEEGATVGSSGPKVNAGK